MRHVVRYLEALSLFEGDQALLPVIKNRLVSQPAYCLQQAFLTAKRQVPEAPKNGRLPGK